MRPALVRNESPEGGHSLQGRDLSNQDLSGRDLADANLFQADLSGAELLGANLSRANLVRTNLQGAGLGACNLDEVQAQGVNMEGSSLNEASLQGAVLQAANLQNARLCGANLENADLSRADLRGVNLRNANVRGANFDGVRLDGACLRGVHGFEHASWLDIDLQSVDFSGAYLLRSCVFDQNFLHEFRSKSRMHLWLYRVWWLTSNCGRSPLRWGLLTLALVVGFAFMLNAVQVDYGPYETALSPLYMSVVTLTTLGYGDALPVSVSAQVVVMAEVFAGYLMLGGLLSLFANQMARRAE